MVNFIKQKFLPISEALGDKIDIFVVYRL